MANVVGLITARGGSQGVPRKNIRSVAGKPLIAWTVDAACQAQRLSRVILSTDCPEIARIAQACGAEVPFLRPAALAQAQSTHVDVLVHALDWLRENEHYEADYVVTLQPTSPLRRPADIDGAVALALDRNADAVVSLCESLSHPFRIKSMDANGELQEYFPLKATGSQRQDWPTAYWTNGALYINRVRAFLESRNMFPAGMLGYQMPVDRSIDIDTEWDLRLAELILREQQATVLDFSSAVRRTDERKVA